MKRDFQSRVKRLGAAIQKHMIWNIYFKLINDSSKDQNPEMDDLTRAAILGEDRKLIIDMKHLNKGTLWYLSSFFQWMKWKRLWTRLLLQMIGGMG